MTFDGYHLDSESAQRWSAAFFAKAGPQIRNVLANRGNCCCDRRDLKLKIRNDPSCTSCEDSGWSRTRGESLPELPDASPISRPGPEIQTCHADGASHVAIKGETW